MTQTREPPRAVIESYEIDPGTIARLTTGLINQTFSCRRADGSDCVLQQVNPIFPAVINDDIDAVTTHLKAKGVVTPELVPTAAGASCCLVAGCVWRLLTRIAGETFETVDSDAMAREAGRVLGDFHRALADFDRPLSSDRPGVHDLDRHLGVLRDALQRNDRHASHDAVSRLADDIFALATGIESPPPAPLRLIHGDPKISNIVFDRGRGVGLVDLDTIARTPVALELGDALRSWCNPAAEDSPAARFSLERYEAAIEGYRIGAPELLTPAEWQAVPDATLAIATELAARFAADALNESYFAWDSGRFASAGAHNRQRAAAQLRLATDIERLLPSMRQAVVTLA